MSHTTYFPAKQSSVCTDRRAHQPYITGCTLIKPNCCITDTPRSHTPLALPALETHPKPTKRTGMGGAYSCCYPKLNSRNPVPLEKVNFGIFNREEWSWKGKSPVPLSHDYTRWCVRCLSSRAERGLREGSCVRSPSFSHFWRLAMYEHSMLI